MKILFYIILTFFYFISYSQDTLEICDDEIKTISFYSNSNTDGINTWTVNGETFLSEELIYYFTEKGTYNISVRRDNVLCYTEQNTTIIVTECPGIIYWVPNCFTPDGNEYNQFYGPIMTDGYDINGFEFCIFNRWGNLIWKSYDPQSKWDGTYNGKKCSDGVYIWKIRFDVLGSDKKIIEHGHLTLIR